MKAMSRSRRTRSLREESASAGATRRGAGNGGSGLLFSRDMGYVLYKVAWFRTI